MKFPSFRHVMDKSIIWKWKKYGCTALIREEQAHDELQRSTAKTEESETTIICTNLALTEPWQQDRYFQGNH